MKSRLFTVLVFAGVAAGVFLLWTDQHEQDRANHQGELSRLQQQDNASLFAGLGKQESATRPSVGGPGAVATRVNGLASEENLSSLPYEPVSVERSALDLAGDKDSGKPVIGGTVEDEEGNPQSHFEVVAERTDHVDSGDSIVSSAIENRKSAFSDFNGHFIFNDLEVGEYRLSLAPVDGIAPARTRVRAGTLNAKLVVVTPRDVRVHGTVSSSNGTPIKDVNIVAAPTERSASSESSGEYELDINWLGKGMVYTVLFQKRGFRQEKVRVSPADLDSEAGEFQLDVSMEPIGPLTMVAGRLTDTEGTPLSGETIHLLTPRMRTWHHVQSDSKGYFLFEEVEPGKDHRLQIRPSSVYKNKDLGPLLVPAEGLSLDIELERHDTGELSGWMVDLDGRPIPGFALTLRSNTATARSVRVVGDQEGFFSVEDFPVGDALFLTHSYPELRVQGIHVSNGSMEPVTVILDTGQYVQRGRIIDGFGVPVSQSGITLDWAFTDKGLRSSSKRKITTDQDGQFLFTGLGPDLHTMEISAAGFYTATKTVNVGADPIDIVIELEEATQ